MPLNTGMPTSVPFTECLGLLDLMLTGEEHGPIFDLKGVSCSIQPIEGCHGCFEAATSGFGLMVVYPGWYVGGHGLQVRILIVGDTQACLQWLPIAIYEKLAIIERLPLDEIEKTLCRLAV